MTLEIGGLSIYTYLTIFDGCGFGFVFSLLLLLPQLFALFYPGLQPESHVLPIHLGKVDKPKWHKECSGVYEENLHSGNLT